MELASWKIKIQCRSIPADMHCTELEKSLAEQGIQCGAVVSIRDLLLILQGQPQVNSIGSDGLGVDGPITP